jgi:hypothetical protein
MAWKKPQGFEPPGTLGGLFLDRGARLTGFRDAV